MRETKDKRDQLKDRLKEVEEESERRRLAIEKLLLQALENGKEIEALKEIIFKMSNENKLVYLENERLTKKIGELFKERDELYDKYVPWERDDNFPDIHSKACDGYRC